MSKIIGGSAFGQNDAIIDTRGAILLGNVHVAVIGAVDPTGARTMLALELGGRVNKTTTNTETLYLLDTDGAAVLVSEILGLAGRASPAFLDMLLDRIANLPKGATS